LRKDYGRRDRDHQRAHGEKKCSLRKIHNDC
jgi:hypothetical protein